MANDEVDRAQEYYEVYMWPHEEDIPGMLRFIAGSTIATTTALYGLLAVFPHLKANIDVLLPGAYLLVCGTTLLYLRYVKKAHHPMKYCLPPGDGGRL